MRRARSSLPAGLYEVCTRVADGQLLMTPSNTLNSQVLGVIGRALANTPVRIHAFTFMSNHYHMLLSVEASSHLSDFMRRVNGQVAQRANRLRGRVGAFWGSRFHAQLVSPERACQIWRLRYLLAQGIKSNLVARVDDWPGVSNIPWLRHARPLRGRWQSLRLLDSTGRRRRDVRRTPELEQVYDIAMTPLPCFADVPERDWRRVVRGVIDEIHEAYDAERSRSGRGVVGRSAILAVDPFTRVHLARSRAGPVLASDPFIRRELTAIVRDRDRRWRTAAASIVELAWRVLRSAPGEPGADEALAKTVLPAAWWAGLLSPT